MQSKRGNLFVVSGPSGAGKGTICKEVAHDEHFGLSVSATTRLPREGEIHGTHYYFLDRADFEARIGRNEFVEYNEYCGNLYGTLRSEVERLLSEGKDCILEIDVNGGLNVKKLFPEAVLVFVLPPSLEILRERLIKRGTESIDVIEQRLQRALEEIAVAPLYDYLLINDHLADALVDFEKIRVSASMMIKNSLDFIHSFKL